MPSTTLTKARLLSYFRHGRLIIAEHDGRMWVTDAYILAAFDAKKSPLADLIRDYNLDVEPMVCEVGVTIRKRPGVEPPNIGTLIPPLAKRKQDRRIVQPLTIGGYPVLLAHSNCTAEVWEDSKGMRYSVDKAKRQLVDDLSPSGTWVAQGEPKKPIVKVDEHDKTTALLMPVHTLFSEQESRAA